MQICKRPIQGLFVFLLIDIDYMVIAGLGGVSGIFKSGEMHRYFQPSV